MQAAKPRRRSGAGKNILLGASRVAVCTIVVELLQQISECPVKVTLSLAHGDVRPYVLRIHSGHSS